jgi:hypothetical protein
MSIISRTGSFVQDHVEMILHADESLAIARSGDLEFHSAEEWSDSFDNWLYGIPSDLEAKVALAAMAEGDVIAEEIQECENEEDWAEYEAWLIAREPTLGELEARDLTDAFIGERP